MRAAARCDPRGRENCRSCGHRCRQRGISDRRSRWPCCVLRHQRSVELRGRSSASDRVRPACATRRLPRTTAGKPMMRYGYWLPVFGGWLRNVDDERMEASWKYNSRLARRSEEIGYDLTLVAELNLNDIKGAEAPSLDAWSTAAALAAVTKKLELMV